MAAIHTVNVPRQRLTNLVGGERVARVDFSAGEILHTFFDGDVVRALRAIGRFELENQISIGNDKFSLRVDGSYKKSIDAADNKIEANFLDEQVSYALQKMYQVVYRVAYDRSRGLTLRTGRLGSDWKFYLNRVPVSDISRITTLGINDKLVLWNMTVYGRRMSKIVRQRHGRSIVVAAKRSLMRDPVFRGLWFRAIDVRADLGDGLGAIKRIGILVRTSFRIRTINPTSRGVI